MPHSWKHSQSEQGSEQSDPMENVPACFRGVRLDEVYSSLPTQTPLRFYELNNRNFSFFTSFLHVMDILQVSAQGSG